MHAGGDRGAHAEDFPPVHPAAGAGVAQAPEAHLHLEEARPGAVAEPGGGCARHVVHGLPGCRGGVGAGGDATRAGTRAGRPSRRQGQGIRTKGPTGLCRYLRRERARRGDSRVRVQYLRAPSGGRDEREDPEGALGHVRPHRLPRRRRRHSSRVQAVPRSGAPSAGFPPRQHGFSDEPPARAHGAVAAPVRGQGHEEGCERQGRHPDHAAHAAGVHPGEGPGLGSKRRQRRTVAHVHHPQRGFGGPRPITVFVQD